MLQALHLPARTPATALTAPLSPPSAAVSSVLAIGGIGGLAIGLAGREICENILNGFLIMTTVRRGSRAPRLLPQSPAVLSGVCDQQAG